MNIKHRDGSACSMVATVLMILGAFLVLPLATPLAQAANLLNVSLMDASDGDVVRIEADQMTEYEHFDLDGPPRLLLKFKGMALGHSVRDVRSAGDGVVAVKAGSDGENVMLEIALSERSPYKIEQKLNALFIRFSSTSSSAQVDGASLEGISVRDVDGVTELVLTGQQMDSSHNAFMTENKQQLIIDLWGARSALHKEYFEYAAQRVRNVIVGQSEDRVRIIVGLIPTVTMQQQIEAEPNQLVVRLGKMNAKKVSKKQLVESIDFEPENQNAQVTIRTSGANPVVSVHQENDNVIIDMMYMTLAQGLERSLDIRQFSGPIAQLDSYQLGENVRIVARLRSKVTYSSFQQGNVLTLRLKPEGGSVDRSKAGTSQSGKLVYSGEKTTFNFKDMDIRNALTLIAEMSKLNIIMSGDVSGTITMRLIDVPWDQALDLILTTKGLGKEQVGNVLRIAPLAMLEKEYATKLAARHGSQQLKPLLTEFIRLNFAKASDLQSMLDASSSKAKGGDKDQAEDTSNSLLTSRGTVLIDTRTNTLIVKDTLEAINNLKRLIATIDLPVRQVLIESRIVEATDDFQRDIGVRWGGYINQRTGNNFPGGIALGGIGATESNAAAFMAGDAAGVATGTNLIDLAAGTGPGVGGAIGLTLGSFNGAVNLTLELSAAEADDKIKIVSSPRLITSNMKSATIKQGVKVGVVTPGSANSPATVTMMDASLTMTVTPQITANDGIIMEVKVQKDTPVIFNGVTSISNKEVSTNVYMKSGETVVIGGIYQQDKANSKAGVPFLSQLPIVGYLFKKEFVRNNRSELLIFLTPKVLDRIGSSTVD